MIFGDDEVFVDKNTDDDGVDDAGTITYDDSDDVSEQNQIYPAKNIKKDR